MTVPRIIIGNLLAEDTFAREAGLNPRVVTKKVVDAISAQATLLRVFAGEDDLLWTPHPVDPDRVADLPGLARPRLVSGPLEALPRARQLLAWGETGAVAELRRRIEAGPDERFPAADPRIAARVNHRSFLLGADTPASWRLPGTKMLTCLPELEHYLATMDRPPRDWVLKSPWSAAGRLRHVGTGRTVDPTGRRHVIDLFHRFDELLFEPWVARTADHGVCGVAGDTGATGLRCHRQFVDGYGRFRSIRIPAADPDSPPGLRPAAARAAELLVAQGYRGPFGTDGFSYQDAGGGSRTREVCEINARLTFGHIANEIRERLFPGADLSLLLGVPPEGGRYLPLLHPAGDEPTRAGLLIPA
jgi:hypothetical protein